MRRTRIAAALTAVAISAFLPQPAPAHVNVVAVIVPRSTNPLARDAKTAATEIASKISAMNGFEGRVVSASGTPGSAAASVGATEYVTGQLLNDGSEHLVLVAYRTADDSKVGSEDVAFDHHLGSSFSAEALFNPKNSANASSPTDVSNAGSIDIPSGKQISVMMLGDIGSRISQEGDSFAVQTTEDFYVDGKLVLPKGTPGYGQITHLKRAGSWHAGGELNFVVKRLVTPAGKDVAVDVTGPTADANKDTEHNGNEFGQYLLFGGLGVFSHRGNDMLIKKGAQFHVYTVGTQSAPVVSEGAQPATLDESLITQHN